MKPMVPAAALGLLAALASMMASPHALAGNISSSAHENGGQEPNTPTPDLIPDPSSDDALMNSIGREFGKDNKTIRAD